MKRKACLNETIQIQFENPKPKFEMSTTTATRFETSGNLPVYMKAVSKFAVLEKEEELLLGKRIVAGKSIVKDEVVFTDDAIEAMQMLVSANLRYVVKKANEFIGQGVTIDDLIMEGNLGLITAAGRFDPNENKKFITFAHFHLQKAFNLANGTYGKIVRLPQNQEYDIYKRRKAGEEINTHTVQLDRPVGEKGDNTLGDLILKTNPSDQHDKEHDLLHVNILMDKLDSVSKAIITKRFGLDGEDEMSIKEIAADLDIPQDVVNKTYKAALKKMKPTN